MGPTSLLKVIAASFLLSAAVLARDASNSSQHVVPNAKGDASIDVEKVKKYQSLLEPFRSNVDFTEAFKWKDVLGGWLPPNAVCSPRCLACAAGCSPICCVVGGTQAPGSRSDSPSERSSALERERTATAQAPQFWRPLPIPPLACPCHCEPNCPRYIQAICCYTPGSSARNGSAEALEQRQPDLDSQTPILDHLNPRELLGGKPLRPGIPLDCPCHCEPDCPAYVQAICCETPGTGGRGKEKHSKPQHDVLAMVTETSSGDPVSVLAGVNLTTFDSFITMNLVHGLERADEISYNEETKTFEIILSGVVGPKGQEQTLIQSFQVIDGSRLLEKEQIMLGLGFLARTNSLKVDKEFLTELEEGLPVLTGVKV